MPGRQSRALLPSQILRLRSFANGKRLSLPQLRLSMDAPFKWGVLQRALDGERVWIVNYSFIVDWLDKHCPENPASFDGKAAAAGEFVHNGD